MNCPLHDHIFNKMKKFILLILNSQFLILNSFSQPYQNVLISNTGGPEEVSICINPKNLNQLVAGANINRFFYSADMGYNWSGGNLISSQYGVWGDPAIIVDTAGNFYYFHLSNPPGGSWIDRIVCQKSTDAGMTWNNPGSYMGLNPPRDQDKEWACVDFTGGPRGNWLYCTWTQFNSYGTADSSNILFSRSTDGGLTWLDPATRINQIGGDGWDSDNTVEGAVPAVGPNGELFVAWAGPKIRNSQFGIFFDKSTDGGNTWLANDIYVCDQRGGWDYDIAGINRANGLPITVCDVSNGPYRGTIYINYTDENAPADHDVMLVKSSNGGLNWSAPIKVNYDFTGKEQFFTWMTIDQLTGYLYFVFYDRRNYNDTRTDVFMARSTNGGQTFNDFRISETPFIPTSSVFFGDYINVTAHYGIVRPIWTRLESGQLSIWTAIIDYPVAIAGTNNDLPSGFALMQNYPNPFNAGTMIKFSISSVGAIHDAQREQLPVQVKIYDILGKQVATLVNEELSPGTYEIPFNGTNYASGVYYYTLTAGDYLETKRMVLSK
jgi:hypothetical protein